MGVVERLSLHLLDVGKGDAILIDFPDGSFGLIDTGPNKRDKGIVERIEHRKNEGKPFRFVAITHWDADHAAGVPFVLGYKPYYFYRPEVDISLLEKMSQGWNHALADEIAHARGDNSIEEPIYARKKLDVPEGVVLVALSPDQHVMDELRYGIQAGMTVSQLRKYRNRASAVLWLRFGGVKLFLTGEVQTDQFIGMSKLFRASVKPLKDLCGSPKAHWIKLSHHGAHDNNSPELFQYFARKNFVASASAGGANGHPHPAVLGQVVQHGGVAMCTRLGQGCGHIQKHNLNTKKQIWLSNICVKDLPNPHQPCYGDITVSITREESGPTTFQVNGSKIQGCCPYGGPSDGKAILPVPIDDGGGLS